MAAPLIGILGTIRLNLDSAFRCIRDAERLKRGGIFFTKRALRMVTALLALGLLLHGQPNTETKFQKATLAAGAKVFIEPMGGFESYLQAAILSKHLPLTVVTDKSQADFIAIGSWRELDGGFSGNGSIVRPLRTRKNYSASVSIVDPKSSAIVFAFSTQKSGSRDLSKEIAEEWATNLLKYLSPKSK